MADTTSRLFLVFDDLRRRGVPLGMSDYLLAVQTFREGVGLDDVAVLRRICRLIWTKSLDDQQLLDAAFARWIDPWLQPPRGRSEPTSTEHVVPDGPAQERTLPKTPALETQTKDPARPIAIEGTVPARAPVGWTTPPGEMLAPGSGRAAHFELVPRLPMRRREMAGIWRHLRRLRRAGPPEELDVAGTIDSICRVGFLAAPVLQARQRNQARLLVLIDRYGSMAPFAPLVDALVESVARGGSLGRTSAYYFHDCPDGVLYREPGLLGARRLTTVLEEEAKGGSVVVVSDAGAARRRYESSRVARTAKDLATLRAHTYRYAWLNPVPADRWGNTSAEEVARLAPMFPLNREGLIDALGILRGQPFPSGVG